MQKTHSVLRAKPRGDSDTVNQHTRLGPDILFVTFDRLCALISNFRITFICNVHEKTHLTFLGQKFYCY